PEHDETMIDGGTVSAFPNGQQPQRILVRFDDGGLLDFTCDHQSMPCPNLTVAVTGFNADHLPTGWTFVPAEGVYKMARTDNPNIMIVKDENGQITAYFVVGLYGSKRGTVVRTYDEAIKAENVGSGLPSQLDHETRHRALVERVLSQLGREQRGYSALGRHERQPAWHRSLTQPFDLIIRLF